MVTLMKLLRVLAALLAGLLTGPGAMAAVHSVAPFFGTYVGTAIVEEGRGLPPRDLRVTVKPHKKGGFSVDWTTTTRKTDGSVKRKRYKIKFRPSERENLYASAMKTNMFGAEVPLNPLAGDPYVWATVHGRILTVYALHITDRGGYEMQVYERTVTAKGIDLKFHRIRDGQRLRTIIGTLNRVK